jgi:uncharacterized protein YjiS (DUF1127 family)
MISISSINLPDRTGACNNRLAEGRIPRGSRNPPARPPRRLSGDRGAMPEKETVMTSRDITLVRIESPPRGGLRALFARLSMAWGRRRTRRILRRLDAEQLADVGLAPGSPARDRWL